EELDADWTQVRVEGAPADAAKYNNLFWGPAQGTGGSTALANSWEQLRKAGAAARAMLVAAAAERWRAPAGEIRVSKGVVSWKGRKATFGQLAADAGKQKIPAEVKLKDPARYVYIGKSAPRIGAKLKSFDAAPAKAIPGVVDAVAFSTPATSGVAVLARDYPAARQGR